MSGIKIPLGKPEIIDTLSASLNSAELAIKTMNNYSFSFNQAVDWLFWTCVEILKMWRYHG